MSAPSTSAPPTSAPPTSGLPMRPLRRLFTASALVATLGACACEESRAVTAVRGDPAAPSRVPPRVDPDPPKAPRAPTPGANTTGISYYSPQPIFPLLTTTWYTFDDRELAEQCDDGTSESHLYDASDVTQGPPYVVGWRGRVTRTYKYGFAGVSIASAQADWSDYSGFVLASVGDSRHYRVELGMGKQVAGTGQAGCKDENYDFYGAAFTCGGDTGRDEVTIRFNKLKQNGWGKKVPLDLKDIDKLQLRTVGSPIEEFKCEYWIKEFVK